MKYEKYYHLVFGQDPDETKCPTCGSSVKLRKSEAYHPRTLTCPSCDSNVPNTCPLFLVKVNNLPFIDQMVKDMRQIPFEEMVEGDTYDVEIRITKREKADDYSAMNIYTAWGEKVIFAYPDNDWGSGVELAKKHLVLGEIYTVKHIDVGSSYTSVSLEEAPGWYSSCMFKNVPRIAQGEQKDL